ncbi:putative ABC transporter ATP-binding protein YxlF [Halobacillus andaensis]|uniref:ABC transporter ATP-binding protein YxlF n=1 Tax=Halobacillus andaensis TaxID=1176239 RepID=A0A917B7H2_HALAA|nr:ABC transporter ATP-binding protein [Halobacillus andaensis]MBP2006002.1 ABC-2 type transport system ATP-binding protein [Halobacillus andaensis]GGF24386.1 putative ABC transporter ATP-binding protein YxlF [Halobacillus andaensis]
MIQTNELTKTFGRDTVVNAVSFELKPETCVALLGPNGAGKTTTLRMMAGLIHPTSGSIHLAGRTHKDIRQLIGYLPQHPQFHTWMTGKEFLVYVGRLANLTKSTANDRADQLLVRVGLGEAGSKRIGKYSGGMKQRLGIAQAMIHQPKLLMLDEPVSALDPIGRRDVLNLMEELKQETTLLFSTHILNDAEEASDHLLLMNDGHIIESGSFEEVRRRHAINKIVVRFDESDSQSYLESLRSLTCVNRLETKKEEVHVYVDDLAGARQAIIDIAAKHHWPLVHFEVGKMSLEELFMKVVDQHAVADRI